MMERVNSIYQNEAYQLYLGKIEAYEKHRIYCKHNLSHFLDVARIAWIRCLEKEITVDKEVVYACALLHDIGRWCEYETGEAHDGAGVRLAKEILKDTDYSLADRLDILEAIGSHRRVTVKEEQGLNHIIYYADKASRACHICKVNESCKWDEEKKNLRIEV